ncbi:hypothetical protein GGR92_003563 [Spirosoma lacussanchae]|uniref:hypothetical protein n=1 Tax=Spirosoma lacussanchae TaxID=1884249 RepID=UPI001108D4F5|nr:hypothetical protein [Spirosoma lacussanchae]
MNAQRVISPALVGLAIGLHPGCQKNPVPPGGIGTYLTGQWLLTKKVTRTNTTAFGSLGGQVLEVGNDSRRNFLSISQGGVEQLRLFETRRVTNENAYTVDLYYGNGQMLRYFLRQTYQNGVPQGVHNIQVTPFIKGYAAVFDTVRYHYERLR